MNGMDLCKETHITLGLVHVSIVISRQSSPHFVCAPSHLAREHSPLCSPRFTSPTDASSGSANPQCALSATFEDILSREGCFSALTESPITSFTSTYYH
jgi:hypothetical protein